MSAREIAALRAFLFVYVWHSRHSEHRMAIWLYACYALYRRAA